MTENLLFVIDKMARAGAQRHLLQVVSGLDRRQFRPTVCCLLERGPLAGELEERGVAVETLELKNIMGVRFTRAVYGLRSVIRRRRIALVHSYLFAANIVSPFAGFLSRVPVITSRRDTGFWKKGRHLLAHRVGNALTDRITANSPAVVGYLLDREKAPRNKVALIRNGIAVPAKPPETAERPRDAIVFGCLGNIRPVKGYEYLLAALSELKAKNTPFKALIAGRVLDPDYNRMLTGMVKSHRLEDRIAFLGEVADAGAFLAKIDVFVLPSLSEGFSNALLEAMAAGRPAVATDTGGNREAVKEGETGFIVPPGDPVALTGKLRFFAENRGLASEFGQRGREMIARHFSVDKMCSELQSLYRLVRQG